jgi:hypothetical protein
MQCWLRNVGLRYCIGSCFLLLTVAVLVNNVGATPINPTTQIDNARVTLLWEKTYGGTGDDRALYSLQLDTGFLVVGSTKSHSNITEGWALMINNEGDVIWNNTYLEGSGTELRYALDLSDGFLLIGNQLLYNDVNGYIMKIDLTGQILWKTVVGGVNIDKLFAASRGAGCFAVFGLTYPDGNDEKSSAWVIQLDYEGNIVWQNTCGEGLNTALRSGFYVGDGYVAAGYCQLNGNNNYTSYLAKIASNGSILWVSTNETDGSQKIHSMASTPDGYILAGETRFVKSDADALIIKTDLRGKIIWSKNFGGLGADSASQIISSKDGGYLVCGFTFSYGAGQRDFWVFKITDTGEVLWNFAVGDRAFQEAYSISEAGEDEYVVVGWADPAGKPELIGEATYDFWMIKLNLAEKAFPIVYFIIAAAITIIAIVPASLVLKHKK